MNLNIQKAKETLNKYNISGTDFAARFGFEKAYASYDTLLDDPEVEAVYIPLPNNLHCEWVLRAADKGKHILCEKPMGVSAAEEKKMFD